MAVFRSDQAQLTFAVEAAQGGDPEFIEGTSGSASTTLSAAHNAGSRTITVASATGFVVGDTVRIGDVSGATTTDEHEARKIELIDGATFVLDRPTAFYHPSGAAAVEITAIGGDATRNDKAKFVSWIPGVYETIDTPDPEMSMEGRRFLNTLSKRNWSVAYPGQQTLTGSVSDILLLNGWPLLFPIGKVTTTPASAGSGSATLGAAAKKGDVYITLSSSHGISADTTVAIYDSSANTNNATKTTEVRRIDSFPSTNVAKLNYPLSFDHANGVNVKTHSSAPTYWEHEIIETTDLDTVSWHVHMLDSAETNTFDRRYVGGMIDSTTISAEEGGIVSMSWDGVNFLNMVHNQKNQTDVGTNLYNGASITHNMPRYGLMQPIDAQDVGMPSQTAGAANAGTGYPSTQPYYFSQGTIKFFGTEFARVRSFSLSIGNGAEPRYYIGRQGNRARGPYEIREGQREYSMSATISLPDSAAPDATDQDTAMELFKQLLLEGDYGTGSKGMSCQLRFDRGTDDYIIIDIPYQHYASGGIAAGTAGSTASGIDTGGLYINTAAHNVTTDNPMQIDADMMFRNLRIVVRDNEAFYP